ncbi:MAG TPA: carbon-nitrogen hydrolase family protein [Acidimicrobiales bacterium]|nr:carbon-nitrogen hydrolase family protein [Acidimicrobiales bacterium]
MGDTYPRLRIAAVQAAPEFLDRDGTIDKACELILRAGRNGADLVGFPENFVPGHPVWFYYHAATSSESQAFNVALFKNSVEIPSDATDRICKAAARAGTNVVLGMTERRPGTTGTLYNTQLFVGRDGQILGRHRKLVPTVGERLVHAWGDAGTQRAVLFDIGPVSGLICGENSNPLAIAALSCQYPYVHVASWPNHFIPDWCGMQETSLLASRNVAYMNKCYVISSCGTNSARMRELLPVTDEDRRFLADPRTSGGSAIIDPLGSIVAGPIAGDREEILYVDTDPDLMLRGRMVHDFVGHYNRADIFRLHVSTRSRSVVEFEDGVALASTPQATVEREVALAVPSLAPAQPIDQGRAVPAVEASVPAST